MKTYSYLTLAVALVFICMGHSSCVMRPNYSHHVTNNMQHHNSTSHLVWYKKPGDLKQHATAWTNTKPAK